MSQNYYVIGINGGGTKTTAVLCAQDTKILAEAQNGPSNFHVVGKEKSANIIIGLIQNCCRSVGCDISQIGAVVVGLAGAGRISDQQEMTEEILNKAKERDLELNALLVESDARITLEGALNGNPGIIIISGTGSIVYAKDEKGKIYRAGGWGRYISDEGSGYVIGQEAFRAVAKFVDGFKQKTKLVKLFKDRLRFETQEDIIRAIYKENFDIASAAPLVIEAASSGDKIAKEILRNAANGLTLLLKIVVANMNKGRRKPARLPIVFSGSLIEKKNLYSQMLEFSIKKNIPYVFITKSQSSPVIGAVLMAVKSLNYKSTNQ